MSFFDFLKTKSTPKYKEEVLKIEILEVKKILNKFLEMVNLLELNLLKLRKQMVLL